MITEGKPKNLFQRVLSLFLAGTILTTTSIACIPRQIINQEQASQSSYVEQYGKDVGEKLDLFFSDSVDCRPFWEINMYDQEDKSFFIPVDPIKHPSLGREVGLLIDGEDVSNLLDEYARNQVKELSEKKYTRKELKQGVQRPGFEENELMITKDGVWSKNLLVDVNEETNIMVYPVYNKESKKIERWAIIYMSEIPFYR